MRGRVWGKGEGRLRLIMTEGYDSGSLLILTRRLLVCVHYMYVKLKLKVNSWFMDSNRLYHACK